MDEKEIIKKVAFNIKVTRLQRGLTQFQLAQALGTTLAKLVTIE